MAKKSDKAGDKKAAKAAEKGERKTKMSRQKYEAELERLQGELVKLQY